MPSTLDPGDRKILLIAGSILLLADSCHGRFCASPRTTPKDREFRPHIPPPVTALKPPTCCFRNWAIARNDGRNLPPNCRRIPAGRHSDPRRAHPISRIKANAKLCCVSSSPGAGLFTPGIFLFCSSKAGAVTPASLRRSQSPQVKAFPPSRPVLSPAACRRSRCSATNRWVDSDGNQVPLYGDRDAPVVVTWQLEKGRILWWAAPTPFTNSGITRPGNLAFLLNCVQAARPGAAPGKTTILWDEYFHGYRGSLWDYFQETPVPWAIFQIALDRLVRISGVWPAKRSALRARHRFPAFAAGICRHAGRSCIAARRPARRRFAWLTTVFARSSPGGWPWPPSISNMQLDAAVRERLGWKQPGLFDTLQRAEKGSRTRAISPARTRLKIVQALEHYELLFGLKDAQLSRRNAKWKISYGSALIFARSFPK